MQNIWLKLNLCQNKYPHSKLCIKAIFLRLKSSKHCLWCCDCSRLWKFPGDFGSFPATSHSEDTQDSLSGVSLKLQLERVCDFSGHCRNIEDQWKPMSAFSCNLFCYIYIFDRLYSGIWYAFDFVVCLIYPVNTSVKAIIYCMRNYRKWDAYSNKACWLIWIP